MWNELTFITLFLFVRMFHDRISFDRLNIAIMRYTSFVCSAFIQLISDQKWKGNFKGVHI